MRPENITVGKSGSEMKAHSWDQFLQYSVQNVRCQNASSLLMMLELQRLHSSRQKPNAILSLQPESIGRAPSGLTCDNGPFLEQPKYGPNGMWSTHFRFCLEC